MISALVWVIKGASRRLPEKLKLTDDEIKMLSEVAIEEEIKEQSALEGAVEAEDAAATAQPSQDEKDSTELPASFKMNDYDEEDDDAAIKNYIGAGAGAGAIEDDEEEDEVDGMASDDDNVAMHDDQDDELEIEKEDVGICPTDSVILVAITEEDLSNLEVQVYDDENNGALRSPRNHLASFFTVHGLNGLRSGATGSEYGAYEWQLRGRGHVQARN